MGIEAAVRYALALSLVLTESCCFCSNQLRIKDFNVPCYKEPMDQKCPCFGMLNCR